MNRIRKHKKKITLGIVFILLLGLIGFSYSMQGKSTSVGRFAQKVVAVIESPIMAVSGGIQSGVKGVLFFKQVMEENEELKAENAKLKYALTSEKLNKEELKQLKELSNVLNYESIKTDRTFVAANVVSFNNSDLYHFFTINKGSKDGLYENAIVLDGSGFAGTVHELGDTWSKVMPIINTKQKISFSVFRDLGLIGILQGDGTNQLKGFMLDSTAGVIEGDTLVTSNVGMYPVGIEIGKVVKVNFDGDTQLKTVEIMPSVDFANLQKVVVVL